MSSSSLPIDDSDEQRTSSFTPLSRQPPTASSNISNPATNSAVNFEANFQQQSATTTMESNWMESVWAPPNLLSIIASGESPLADFPASIHQHHQQQQHSGGSFHSSTSSKCSAEEQCSPHLRRPGPIRQQHPPYSSTNSHEFGTMDSGAEFYEQQESSGNECGRSQRRLIVIREPEEQHRARYASEGSRGAIKDRSGTSYCSIQLTGYYRPTRVELFAAERDVMGHHGRRYVHHSQYKLIPVAGKSSTMTPCKQITAENGTECLEIVLRPENRMIGILDCIGIMKMCSYDSREGKRPKRRKRKAVDGGKEDQQQMEDMTTQQQNCVHIVARAFVPPINNEHQENDGTAGPSMGNFDILQAVTEPIRCVQQLGTPDVLKMSLESSTANGGQEMFIIGRNFDPKDTKILFREYRNDGSLGWSAEASIDRRFLHQCHVVCTVPACHSPYRSATVSVTVICGAKQSHPKNFHYAACEREDDDWRPPDCSTGTCGGGGAANGSNNYGGRRRGGEGNGGHQHAAPHRHYSDDQFQNYSTRMAGREECGGGGVETDDDPFRHY